MSDQIDAGQRPSTLRFADSSDWLLTKSGEWVRGGVDWMRDDIMELDSEEFGALEIHMRDVAAIHSPNPDTYIFADRTSMVGAAIITRGQVVIQTEHGVVVRPRDSLWAIVEGGVRELDYWSVRLDLGFSANRGNSEQLDFNLGFFLEREDTRTLSQLGYALTLGFADRELNVSRHIVLFLNKVWVTKRFFVHPIVGDLLSDRFQDTRFRAQPGAGVGVRFLDLPNAWWNLASGLGYQYLNLYDPATEVPDPQHGGTVWFSTRARFDFTADIYFLLRSVSNVVYTHIGNTNHIGSSELRIEVTNILNFETSFLYLRTEDPPLRANGTRPVKNDYQLVFGIALQLG